MPFHVNSIWFGMVLITQMCDIEEELCPMLKEIKDAYPQCGEGLMELLR